MADLTKEYFDKQLKNLATKQDIGKLDKKIDKLEIELKSFVEIHVEEKIDVLARAVNTGFEDVIKRLDFRERVEELERKMSKMEKALNLRL
ncbi:MAG: hypothetical protein A3I92_00815 [Candidatus Yanofskybacteria bacterium RIFCSPLOWO2_02_FULL_43_10b]|uniref:Uncharacterized protein n=1 Tax=Candidatus Yanofskybacteria bacterium RIFCSPLOWO2_02_FULL_43_10b TaxID=1802704 RepID=A0A1F8H5G0_9BACT|nr:MAG: hypothetical protein A3I92_00815 [Candidatus Yanofskybacteria bacterium RIFCSPLOWO2_02_FULL_43_10b]